MNSREQRSRLRIHRATAIVLFVVVLLQMMIVIPGHPVVATPVHFTKSRQSGFLITYHHGWPWVYFKSTRMEPGPNCTLDLAKLNKRRKGPLSSSEASNNKGWTKLTKAQSSTRVCRDYVVNKAPHWTILDRWKHYGNRQRLDLAGLLLNFLIVFSIAAVPATIIELRIRTATRAFQIRIADVLAVMTIAALIVGSVASEMRARHYGDLIRQTPIAFNSRYVGTSYDRTQDAPAWLFRLAGSGRCEKFQKVRFLSLSEPNLKKLDSDILDEIAGQVRAYGRIRCIDIFQTGPCVEQLMSQVGRVPRVRVWPAHADRVRWRKMAKTNNWAELTFENDP